MHNPDFPGDTQSRYDRLVESYLATELRLVNSGLPSAQKSLSTLLAEPQPQISCADGTQQMMKRSELRYLSSLLDPADYDSLLLPMLIEMAGQHSEATVLCRTETELTLISAILEMHLQYERPGRLRIYKPQLALVRKKMPTTTQYVLSMPTANQEYDGALTKHREIGNN